MFQSHKAGGTPLKNASLGELCFQHVSPMAENLDRKSTSQHTQAEKKTPTEKFPETSRLTCPDPLAWP